MRALTLTQPFATLVALGAKTIETRSRPMRYHGPLAIHAATTYGGIGGRGAFLALLQEEPFWRVLGAAFRATQHHAPALDELAAWLPLGAVLATCRLAGCAATEDVVGGGAPVGYGPLTGDERAFGDYGPGRWAMLLVDVRPLRVPIPARGALGLWHWAGEGTYDAPRV